MFSNLPKYCIRNSIIITGVYFLFNSLTVLAEDQCFNKTVQIENEKVVATADTLPNFRNIAGSLRFESNRLLENAENALQKGVNLPSNECPPGCKLEEKPEILFSCVPQKYLQESNDLKYCLSMERKTATTPFEYTNIGFDSISQLADWFSDFSQGKGKDGNDLYRRCDQSCSPQYSNQIKRENNKLLLNSSVICGPPRDKSDNKYFLKTFFLWHCVN